MVGQLFLVPARRRLCIESWDLVAFFQGKFLRLNFSSREIQVSLKICAKKTSSIISSYCHRSVSVGVAHYLNFL